MRQHVAGCAPPAYLDALVMVDEEDAFRMPEVSEAFCSRSRYATTPEQIAAERIDDYGF